MADASASFELEDDSLAAGLDAIAARFAAIAAQINAAFAGVNARLGETVGQARSLGATSPIFNAMSRALSLAANAAGIVVTTLAGIASVAMRIAPFIKYIPDTMGKWVKPVKEAAAEYVNLAAKIGLVTKGAAALSGRLTILQAGMGALEMSELGASKQMIIFGTAGALALSKVIALSRSAVASLGGITSRIAGVARGVSGAFSSTLSGIARVGVSFAPLLAPVASLGLALAPIALAAAGVAVGFHAIKKGVEAAAETQQLQTSFITLLGSADAAQRRMAELSKFAQDTPFEIPGVTRASRVLEVLTKGALSTGAGLRMVGDVAAVSGQPIEELAVHIGRVYSALMHGGEAGESFRRLQELGVISMETRNKLEALQKQGLKGAAVWAVGAKDLMRFSGEMQRQSLTWSGMMSNLNDAIGNTFRALGQPIITALTPYFLKLIDLVGNLKGLAEKFGNVVAGWGALIAEIFSEGKISEALSRSVKIGLMEAVNVLAKAFAGAGNVLALLLGGVAREFVMILQAATTSQFWSGIGNALKAAGLGLVSILLEGVAKVLATMRNLPEIGETVGKAADSAHAKAEEFAGRSLAAGNEAAPDLAGVFHDIERNIKDVFAHAGEAFAEGQRATGNVFDTDAARADFARFIQPIAANADKAIRAAKAAAEKGGLPPPIGQEDTSTAGHAKSEVASLQRIAGGGGFSFKTADPLLSEARTQTGEIKGLRGDVAKLTAALTQRRPGPSVPVFGPF